MRWPLPHASATTIGDANRFTTDSSHVFAPDQDSSPQEQFGHTTQGCRDAQRAPNAEGSPGRKGGSTSLNNRPGRMLRRTAATPRRSNTLSGCPIANPSIRRGTVQFPVEQRGDRRDTGETLPAFGPGYHRQATPVIAPLPFAGRHSASQTGGFCFDRFPAVSCATSFLHDHGRRDALSLIAQGNKLAALRGSAGAKYRPEGGVGRLRCPLRLPPKLTGGASEEKGDPRSHPWTLVAAMPRGGRSWRLPESAKQSGGLGRPGKGDAAPCRARPGRPTGGLAAQSHPPRSR